MIGIVAPILLTSFHETSARALLSSATSALADLGLPQVKVDSVAPPPEVFVVPTTAKCIVVIMVQYMMIHAALAVCRTVQEFAEIGKGPVEEGLKSAAQTLTYGPMICVLFIACRMQVEFTADGMDQPQLWVQNCMIAMTFAVIISSVLVFFIPMAIGRPVALTEEICCNLDLERQRSEESSGKALFYVLSSLRYLMLFGLYVGLAGIIIGICTYLPPGATDLSRMPAPAPAILCTMALVVFFFMAQLVVAVCRSYTEFTQTRFPRVIAVMDAAASTVELAPMLAAVFLAARMRALQHDGQPQAWVGTCMFVATGSMILTTLLAVLVPVTMGGTVEQNQLTKEITFKVPNPSLGYIMVFLRFACMICLYGGVVSVIYSIFTFESPAGPEATVPVSPTVHCVVHLTCQYFFVYTILIFCLTVAEISGGRSPLDHYKLFSAVEASKSTLAFAPMLAVLFVSTRMFALLITDKRGAPQAWVQDSMVVAAWSLMLSFLACLTIGFVMDEVEFDDGGNVINKFAKRHAATAMVAVRYFAMLLLYGGIVSVICGLFMMTPDNAVGRGSIPLAHIQ
jgi:hypothetical protein|mmetsp:Transcript_79297/g.123700  ORF Transcript_79297/g.123700 Transcript_79297/m.123700 type:complete len:569 (+) Transcript_79297:93-1799(+)